MSGWRNNQGYDNGRNERQAYGPQGGGGQQRGGYRGGNRGGGNSRPQGNGGGRPGQYKPNTGKIRPNERMRQGQNDPQMTGVGNCICPHCNAQNSYYLSGWWNDDETMGLGFRDVNEASQGNTGQQRQGGYGANRGGNGGGYQQQSQPQYEPRENGAMSRARPIPQPQYRDEPPPHDGYPEEREPYLNDEIPF